MKNIFSLITLMFVLNTCCLAQRPAWAWASNFDMGNLEPSDNSYLVRDSAGNIYRVGTYRGQIQIGNDVLDSIGNKDIFLTKYNSSGQPVWSRKAGGLYDDIGSGIGVDRNGNVYISGCFQDTAYFGNIKLVSVDTSPIRVSAFGRDVFLAKYDPNGNVKWAIQEGGAWEDWGWAVAVDKWDNIYTTGFFGEQDNSTIPTNATFGNVTLTSSGESSVFITKHDTSGHLIWAKGAIADGLAMPNNIITDKEGNIVVAGTMQSLHVDFDTVRLYNAYPPTNIQNMFVAKYDSSGHALWARGGGGPFAPPYPSTTYGTGVAEDKQGNVYVTGVLANTYTKFGNVIVHGSVSIFNAFLVKYNAAGQQLWAKNAGLDPYDNNQALGITIDTASNFYITGYFGGEADCGLDTMHSNLGDAFVAKYDTNGNPVWGIKPNGGIYGSQGASIISDNAGNLYLTGYNSPSANFGSSMLANSGIFLAKLSTNTTGIPQGPHLSESDISIFPNPASGSFMLRTTKSSYSSLTIADPLGRTVYTQALQKGIAEQKINVPAAIASGMYYVTLSSEYGCASQKLIIEH